MNAQTNDQTPIYSDFGDDEDFAEIVEAFANDLPERVVSVEQAYQDQDWDSLNRLAHQLKGACGSYGFHELTPFAFALERAARDENIEQIEKALNEFVGVCQRVRTGAAP